MSYLKQEDEDWFTYFLNIVLSWFIAMPINALVLSKTAAIIWRWTVQSRYGEGPSLGAWFGLSCIFGLFLGAIGVTTKERPEDRSRLAHTIILTLGLMVGCVFMLGGVALVRKMLGWH